MPARARLISQGTLRFAHLGAPVRISGCDVLAQVLASAHLHCGGPPSNLSEHTKFAGIADGIPFAKGLRHTHGSAAVIGRNGVTQNFWDDACTASVPIGLVGKRAQKFVTNPAQVANK